MRKAKLNVFRGTKEGGEYKQYEVPVEEGMVVLDAIHYIQQTAAPDLAVRWNCKAAKCGSCSAEVNGKPSLMCKTRMDRFADGEEIKVQPIKTFPIIKDLVTDVSWNYEVNKKIKGFTPPPDDGKEWIIHQEDIDRVQEFRSASSVSSAKTSATYCAITIAKTPSWDHASWFVQPVSRCIQKIRLTA